MCVYVFVYVVLIVICLCVHNFLFYAFMLSSKMTFSIERIFSSLQLSSLLSGYISRSIPLYLVLSLLALYFS